MALARSLIKIKTFGLYLLFCHFVLGQDDDLVTLLKGRNKACDVLIGIDEPLWINRNKNMPELVELSKDFINGLNRIFGSQVFTGDFQQYYFNLKRVEIVFGSCESHLLEKDYKKNCTEQRENFLEAYENSRDTSDFCLAYLLTFRDFHNGTAGLASIGTVCRRIQNAGFVTMLNYNRTRSLNESIITFAHEVAHSFDANHDDNFDEREDCYGKGFIMDELFNSSNLVNHNKFSNCSLDSMVSKLTELEQSLGEDECFKNLDFDESFPSLVIAQCGNGIVEEGEQCDCGLDHFVCNDPCCYPAYISDAERSANNSAMSCQRTERYWCQNQPGIVYGFYVPWAVIICIFLIIFGILYRDWHRSRQLFKHITENRVIIKQ